MVCTRGPALALGMLGALAGRGGATYALADAADAPRAREGRTTTGKVLLLP